ncbi:MAG TPA: isopentenyl phosphate kinase [Nitrososphaerales archaeon]|nr:isopentenyl phosphate kinase [Nitrososphaerales archaeon]
MTRGPPRAVTIVKLGGSVITDKRVAFSYREKVVRGLGRAMASCGLPVVVVHGGGSFGHTVAKGFGLSSRRSSPSHEGVAETRGAMLRLDSKVCASLSAAGLHPYPFSPFTLLDGEGGPSFIARLLQGGMTPVTFGDVVHDGKGFRILSGDTICVELAEMLGAPRCVMALDVAGVLDERGAVIKDLSEDDRVGPSPARHGASGSDATGGIALKVREARRMASSGTEVSFVSGLRPAEFCKALKGVAFHGTTVKVPHGVSRG